MTVKDFEPAQSALHLQRIPLAAVLRMTYCGGREDKWGHTVGMDVPPRNVRRTLGSQSELKNRTRIEVPDFHVRGLLIQPWS